MEKQKHFSPSCLGCLLGGILLILVSVIALPELLSQKAQITIATEQTDGETIKETLNYKSAECFLVQPTEITFADITDSSDKEAEKATTELLTTEDVWADVYHNIMYGEGFSTDKLLAMALAKAKDSELQLLSTSKDHLVTYGGESFVITDDDYQVLLRSVESEAPAEDIKGKLLVANVVLNRVLWNGFPNTIAGVVFQKGQFAPISSGYYRKVKITETTIEAVDRALAGEDESKGALFFMARGKAKEKNVKWFDTSLKYLFKYGEHEFFTVK